MDNKDDIGVDISKSPVYLKIVKRLPKAQSMLKKQEVL